MPTKRNRAGEQQNYVEAGHGDASGEYGDKESGSNKHFQQFKKPKETRSGELSKQQIQAMGSYVLDRKSLLTKDEKYFNGLISNFRYYTGMNNPLANQVVELFKNYANELRSVK